MVRKVAGRGATPRAGFAEGPRLVARPCRKSHTLALHEATPAPSPALWALLRVLHRPLPLAELRPIALAAGMSPAEIDLALANGARRGVIRFAADHDGTILAMA